MVIKLTFPISMTLTIDSSCQIEVQTFKNCLIFMLFRGLFGLQEGITNCSTVELKTSQYIIDNFFTKGCLFVGVKVESCRYYTYTMFEVCALWIVKLIQGEMSALPDKVRYHLNMRCQYSS